MRLRLLYSCLAFFVLGSVAHANPWDWSDGIRGEGPVKEDHRPISGVDAVELATIGTLIVAQGDSMSLTVVAEENMLPYLETRVSRGQLTISTRKNANLNPSEPIEYHLTLPKMDELILSSAGDAEMSDWKADRMLIELESSGDLDAGVLICPKLDISLESSGDMVLASWEGQSLRARLSSSGDLKIRGGKTDELDLELSSSGDFSGAELQCKKATVSASSSGDAVLRVSDYLLARSSSSGDVIYYGNPEVDARASSSGDVVHRGGT